MVKWTVPAEQDLKSIHDFIAQDSPQYAQSLVYELVEEASNLNKFPHQGRMVPEIQEENVREIFIGSYRIIYEVINNNIYILALVHMRQILHFQIIRR